MLNKVILMGRLVRDPERRYTQANVPVTSFTLAIDRGRKVSNGERQTDFINCVSWGKQGDFVKEWFTKGMMAIVVGRLRSRNWEDRNGNKRVSIEVDTNEVTFGETKRPAIMRTVAIRCRSCRRSIWMHWVRRTSHRWTIAMFRSERIDTLCWDCKNAVPQAAMGAAGRNRRSLCWDGMLSAGTSVRGQKREHDGELFCVSLPGV